MLKKLLAFIFVSSAPLIFIALLAQLTRAASTVSISSPSASQVITGSSLTVSGQATADQLVTVLVDNDEAGSTVATGGNWSLTLSGLSSGSHTITARVRDVQYIYVANINNNTVRVFDQQTFALVDTISDPSLNGPAICGSNDDRSRLYICSTDDKVTIIDTANRTVAGVYSSPVGVGRVAFDRASNRLFLTNCGSGVQIVDAASLTQLGTVPNPDNYCFSDIVSNQANGRVYALGYVVDAPAAYIQVIEAGSGTLLQTITGPSASRLILSSDSKKLYLSSGGVDTITYAVNLADNAITNGVPVGNDAPVDLAADPGRGLVYIANSGAGTVTFWNTLSNSFDGSPLSLPAYPTGLDLAPHGRRLFALQYDSGEVAIIDTTTRTIAASFNAGAAASAERLTLAPYISITASVTVTLAGAGASLGGITRLPTVGLTILLPFGLAFLVSFAYVVWDWRRHRRPLVQADPQVQYSLTHHIKYVTLPTINYRLGLTRKRLPLVPVAHK